MVNDLTTCRCYRCENSELHLTTLLNASMSFSSSSPAGHASCHPPSFLSVASTTPTLRGITADRTSSFRCGLVRESCHKAELQKSSASPLGVVGSGWTLFLVWTPRVNGGVQRRRRAVGGLGGGAEEPRKNGGTGPPRNGQIEKKRTELVLRVFSPPSTGHVHGMAKARSIRFRFHHVSCTQRIGRVGHPEKTPIDFQMISYLWWILKRIALLHGFSGPSLRLSFWTCDRHRQQQHKFIRPPSSCRSHR